MMYLLFAIMLVFPAALLQGQPVVINEMMSQNVQTLFDEDGDTPDWIEIYNPGIEPLNLLGWGLSDNPGNPDKWTFPDITMQPREILLVYASGKDRKFYADYTETIIRQGDNWKYFLGFSDPPADWKTLGFDAGNWQEGPSGFGFGDDDDATVVQRVNSVFVRTVFTVDDLDAVDFMLFHVDYDDGFVAFLNNQEIARGNIGQPGSIPHFDHNAELDHEAEIFAGGVPELFIINNFEDYLNQGDNVLAVQVHNSTLESSDLSLIPFLTIGFNQPPAEQRGLAEILTGAMPRDHTNFRLNAQGETVLISTPLDEVVDQIAAVEMTADVSYGRQPDGADSWFFFEQPTPGSPNITVGRSGPSFQPIFSEESGLYDISFLLGLSSPEPNSSIYYTLDGSLPTIQSSIYGSPIRIDTTTVVRAMAIQPGNLPSTVVSKSYIVGFETVFPVVSLITDPPNFFDDEIGMYVLGNEYEAEPPHRGANYWQDWERPVYIEFFEPDGELGFQLDVGAKIHGGWTRFFPQKSLGIYARSQYGEGDINYQIFPELDINIFESFILRNSGSDWDHTMFRDAFMVSLVDDTDQDIQAYRPSVLFINGVYWGLHNLREKKNEHYAASHYNLDSDSVDVMNVWGGVTNGDNAHYTMMMDFLNTHDLSNQADYEYVSTLIDIENFINYNVTHIYLDNTDWPGNNNEMWRPHQPGGKWRWFLFDTDFGFGLHDDNAYMNNTLQMATAADGQGWPNPPEATFVIRKLLENNGFKEKLINRFADFMNFNFQPERVFSRIDSFKTLIDPEITRHLQRWDRDLVEWNERVDELYFFGENRPEPFRGFVEEKFELSGSSEVFMNVSDRSAGYVRINTKVLQDYPFVGKYFNDVLVQFEAVAQRGYIFSRWEGTVNSNDPRITWRFSEDIQLTAVFAPVPLDSGEIVINEINFRSPPFQNTDDWVELYAKAGNHNLQDYVLRDRGNNNEFIFPAGTFLQAGQYLIIARDTTSFRNFNPGFANVLGDLSFGFNTDNEEIKLYNSIGELIDSVGYTDSAPWRPRNDSTWFTFELSNPLLPNDYGENWRASPLPQGSPGLNNIYNPPLAFALVSPTNNSTIESDSVRISWTASGVSNIGGSLEYIVELALDSLFTNSLSFTTTDTTYLVDRVPELTQFSAPASDACGATRFSKRGIRSAQVQSFDESASLHWRVRAITDRGLESFASPGQGGWSFMMGANTPPTAFRLLSPDSASVTESDTVLVTWMASSDPEGYDSLYYEIEWSLSADYLPSFKVTTLETSFLIDRVPGGVQTQATQNQTGKNSGKDLSPDQAAAFQSVYWRVRAVDDRGLDTWGYPGQAGWFFGMPTFEPPAYFELVSPRDSSVINADMVRAIWTKSPAPEEEDTIKYKIEWSVYRDFYQSSQATTTDTFFVIEDDPTFRIVPDFAQGNIFEPHGRQVAYGDYRTSALPDSQTIFWRVIAENYQGMTTAGHPGLTGWSFSVIHPPVEPPPAPEQFAVEQPYPNPFNAFFVTPIEVVEAADVSFAIYNLHGAKVYHAKRRLSAGFHRYVIQTDDIMTNMNSGVYLLKVNLAGKNHYQKVVLLK